MSDCATSLFVSSFDVACTHLQQLPPGTGHLDHAAGDGDGDGDGDGYLANPNIGGIMPVMTTVKSTSVVCGTF